MIKSSQNFKPTLPPKPALNIQQFNSHQTNFYSHPSNISRNQFPQQKSHFDFFRTNHPQNSLNNPQFSRQTYNNQNVL